MRLKAKFQIQLFNCVVRNLVVSVAIFERRMRVGWILVKIWQHFASTVKSFHISQNKARCPAKIILIHVHNTCDHLH